MPLPEAKTIVSYRNVPLKEVLGPRYALNTDPQNLMPELATVSVADSLDDRFRYASVAFEKKKVIGEPMRVILEGAIPKPDKVTERQTVGAVEDDLVLMKQRAPVYIDLQMAHEKMIGPDWNGAWNLYDLHPFYQAIRTIDPTQRDALFAKDISALITKTQAIHEFPTLALDAIKKNHFWLPYLWEALKDNCNLSNTPRKDLLDIKVANFYDDPAPFVDHLPLNARVKSIDRLMLHDVKTVIDTEADSGQLMHKANRNRYSTVHYAGNKLVMVMIQGNWVSVELSEDGNHKKLGEHKTDPYAENGIYPQIVTKTDKHTGESDLVIDVREIPDAILDTVTHQANARFGAITVAASSPKERDQAENPVNGRNMIEAQMPTVWAWPHNRQLLVPSKLVQGIIEYGMSAT